MQVMVRTGPPEGLDTAALEATIMEMVRGYVGDKVVTADEPLAQQGLDSLAAMELRQKLQVPTSAQHSPWTLAACILSQD